MAYDRNPTRRPYGRDGFYDRDGNRDDYRLRADRDWDRGGTQHDRGFFERAGDEIASWFGDDEAERRRRMDDRYDERGQGDYGRRPVRTSHDFGDEGFYSASGIRSDNYYGERRPARGTDSQGPQGFMGSRDFDPHYRNWRQQQIDSLDRDYHEYRRENQTRFDSDFGNWRDRRMGKRSMLTQAVEHMEVVGSDNKHVGKVDRIRGDRIILAKSDPDSGGIHHSISCADIDKIEKDKIVLEYTADQAKSRWRDEARSRALFEREDQGDSGPHILDRSFEGTYR
jgi:hypothetical protein